MSSGNGPESSALLGTMSDRLSHLRDATAEKYRKAKDKALEWKHGSEEYIRRRPLRVTLGAAAVGIGVGILAGYLIARRKK